MENSYERAVEFWNQAFDIDKETKEEYKKIALNENGYKDLAASEKLKNVLVEQLASKSKVLDYGCGEGWAGITLNKSGCKDVTCVDVVENAIKLCNFLKTIFKVEGNFTAQYVSDNWIKTVSDKTFDGIFCSNVIDVLPTEVSDVILENFARIATKDAKIVISMNFYTEPVNKPEKHIEFRNGNELYSNGVLRMVTRTDEEWKAIFEKFFDVEKIEYFAWPGEEQEKRRIFIMNNR